MILYYSSHTLNIYVIKLRQGLSFVMWKQEMGLWGEGCQRINTCCVCNREISEDCKCCKSCSELTALCEADLITKEPNQHLLEMHLFHLPGWGSLSKRLWLPFRDNYYLAN